jgi:hypothetical protein
MRRSKLVVTFDWHGRPKWGWRRVLRIYRTARGGVAIWFGLGSITLRIDKDGP